MPHSIAQRSTAPHRAVQQIKILRNMARCSAAASTHNSSPPSVLLRVGFGLGSVVLCMFSVTCQRTSVRHPLPTHQYV